MANQQNIIPTGHLHGLTIDIEGERAIVDFQVIEIVDDSNPYLVLLGIDQVFDTNVVINLTKHILTFEKKELRFIAPLDPPQGVQYTEPVRDYYQEDDIEQVYKITTRNEDYINL